MLVGAMVKESGQWLEETWFARIVLKVIVFGEMIEDGDNGCEAMPL